MNRTELPLDVAFESQIAFKGRFVFLCPACGEMLVAVNPRNNLAHCFACGKNFNNIDLLLALDYDFRSAVARLERLLREYRSRRSQRSTTEVK